MLSGDSQIRGSRRRLERRIQREARGLQPSVELPWSPPWGRELAAGLVDVLADVAVLQAELADARTWDADDDGRRRRATAVESAASLRARCVALGFAGTARALREIASSLQAWDALGRG